MGIIRVIFELLVLYILYKLIFDFVIPVYKSSKEVSKKVEKMRQQMKEYENQDRPLKKEPASKVNKEDYIDFEEVK
ncbi:MAG: hypothetical protein R2765_02555 [Ferruginibacter sp.]|nr:hypothetical protein [Bacteroidota bacterium]MBX2918237.1 hypothetical protein [Ferruginibacter sp.]MCB0709011.1 hypothetical protein [Chitinophagaceae bacterium]MCC7377835.1 hypothetical protein [Chitinophagaceae bacterium]